jgi:hypothetical protein
LQVNVVAFCFFLCDSGSSVALGYSLFGFVHDGKRIFVLAQVLWRFVQAF